MIRTSPKPEPVPFDVGDRVTLRIDSHPRPGTIRRIIDRNVHPWRIVVDSDGERTPYTVRADQLEPLETSADAERLPYGCPSVSRDGLAFSTALPHPGGAM